MIFLNVSGKKKCYWNPYLPGNQGKTSAGRRVSQTLMVYEVLPYWPDRDIPVTAQPTRSSPLSGMVAGLESKPQEFLTGDVVFPKASLNQLRTAQERPPTSVSPACSLGLLLVPESMGPRPCHVSRTSSLKSEPPGGRAWAEELHGLPVSPEPDHGYHRDSTPGRPQAYWRLRLPGVPFT